MTEELIAEARAYALALHSSVHVRHTGAELIEKICDALEAASQPLTVDDLIDTKAGLLLAHNSFEHGMQAMIHSVNASTPGEVWQKPDNPYWKALGSLLTAARDAAHLRQGCENNGAS